MIRLFENAIPQSAQDELEHILLHWNFPWFHYANTNYTDNVTRLGDVPQFTHGFIRDDQANSAFEHIPRTLLRTMNIPDTDIIRAKANLLCREPQPATHPAHTDDNAPHVGLIYYVNNSDGDTHFYEKGKVIKTVSPKKGRAVMFKGDILHASSSPVSHRYRIVLNFNLKPNNYFK